MRWSLVPVVVLLVLLLPGRASAARIPVLYGDGEAIAFIADLPASAPLLKGLNRPPGDRPTKVGYKYQRWHIFWAPMWTYTSGGEFVAYNDAGLLTTTYIPLGTDPEQVKAQTQVPVWKLTVPAEAWHLWGLYLFLVVMGVLSAIELRRWRPAKTKPKQEWSCDPCFACGVVTPLFSWESMPDGRRYIKARCPKCDTLLAVAPQTRENIEKADEAERSPSLLAATPWWIWALLGGVLLPLAGALLRPWSISTGLAVVVSGVVCLAAGMYGFVAHCLTLQGQVPAQPPTAGPVNLGTNKAKEPK